MTGLKELGPSVRPRCLRIESKVVRWPCTGAVFGRSLRLDFEPLLPRDMLGSMDEKVEEIRCNRVRGR
jgi:hypothetical protein